MGAHMGAYKALAYLAIGILLFAYGAWLKKAKAEGRAQSFWHKDISGILIVLAIVGGIIAYLVNLK